MVRTALLSTLMLLFLAAGPASVEAQTTIVGVVNGQPITSYDLAQREKLMRLTGVKGNVRSQAIDELVDEALQMHAAKASGITVPVADVDRAIDGIAKRVELTTPQLKQVLSQSGTSIDSLQTRIRAQIAFGRLVRARFSQSLEVTEQDLVAALLKDDDLEKVIDTFEYDLEQVIIALPKDPSASRLASAKSLAGTVSGKFTSCSDGLRMAKSTRNVVVRPFGRRTAAELTQAVQEAVKDVPLGRLSAPIESAQGLTMFAVCDKKEIRSTNAAMKQLEPEMAEERGEAFQKQYLRQLRRDAVIDMR